MFRPFFFVALLVWGSQAYSLYPYLPEQLGDEAPVVPGEWKRTPDTEVNADEFGDTEPLNLSGEELALLNSTLAAFNVGKYKIVLGPILGPLLGRLQVLQFEKLLL